MIDIHGLVNIEVDENLPQRKNLIDSIADVLILPNIDKHDSSRTTQLKIIYKKYFSVKGMRKITKYGYVQNRTLIDKKYGIQLEIPNKNLFILQMNNSCLEWFIWVLQLIFLTKGITFVHSATLEKNGKALIFPAHAGMGKTALTIDFIKNHGWRILGDDLVLLSSDGICYAFPKPMTIYSYYNKILPEIFNKDRGPIIPKRWNVFFIQINKRIKRLLRPFPMLLYFARKHNPRLVYINPSKILGIKNLAKEARLRIIIWLERTNKFSSPMLRRSYNSFIREVLQCTISEFDMHCVQLTNIAIAEGAFMLEPLDPIWTKIIEEGFKGSVQYILSLPSEIPIERISKIVNDLLIKNAVLNKF